MVICISISLLINSQGFVREFKNTYQRSQQTIMNIFAPELTPLLSENYDFDAVNGYANDLFFMYLSYHKHYR